MTEKTIICLANSYKHGGRCIAGREVVGGEIGAWVRPISSRPGHEVGEHERHYADRGAVAVLDIADVSLVGHSPSGHQPENYVLAGNGSWRRLGSASWTQVYQCADAYDPAFWHDYGSTRLGQADKMSPREALEIGSSLKLILVHQLVISVRSRHEPRRW